MKRYLNAFWVRSVGNRAMCVFKILTWNIVRDNGVYASFVEFSIGPSKPLIAHEIKFITLASFLIWHAINVTICTSVWICIYSIESVVEMCKKVHTHRYGIYETVRQTTRVQRNGAIVEGMTLENFYRYFIDMLKLPKLVIDFQVSLPQV